MKKEYALLIGVGILSGLVNTGLVLFEEDFVFSFLPGILYGLVVGVYFVRQFNHMFIRFVSWIIASTASYWLAIQIGAEMTTNWSSQYEQLIFPAAGFAGALILTITFHFIFQKLKITRHVAIALAGALLAFLAPMLSEALDQFISENLGMPMLYVLWQTGITVLLGSSLLKKKSRN